MFLVNSRLGRFPAPEGSPPRDPFSRSYGANLPSSLTRVLSPAWRVCPPPTSVGLRYGRRSAPRGLFVARRSAPSGRGRPPPSQDTLPAQAAPTELLHRPAGPTAQRPPRFSTDRRYRTINRFPIACGRYACGLGPTNPTRMHLPSEPLGLRRTRFSRAWTLLIPAFALRSAPGALPGLPSPPPNAPLPPDPLVGSTASVACVAPLHCRRRQARPVSYYALFQGWLLLSQPPGCLSLPTSFPTQHAVGDLSRWSGLFPSRRRSLAPAVSLRDPVRTLRSLPGFGKRSAPEPKQRSTRPDHPPALHLNAFRGEPAISAFAWHFTPTHSSSHRFAPRTRSGLHAPLRALHPGHG